MTSPAVPGEFGNVAIDFGGNQPRSDVKMAAEENRPPTVSGPGCQFVVRQVPVPGFPNEHEVDVKPPQDGGSCVVVIPRAVMECRLPITEASMNVRLFLTDLTSRVSRVTL
ncbi:hypothetical protein KBI23_05455 [bacterium]|nr:hypothetical protein [bacterium]MBP9807890.1 hypothetical protein [bacterium]